jgi:hypothetical protein
VRPLNLLGEGALRTDLLLVGTIILVIGAAVGGTGLAVWNSAVADYNRGCTGFFYDVDCADALAKGSTFATVALVGGILFVVGLLITMMGALLKRETPSHSILS